MTSQTMNGATSPLSQASSWSGPVWRAAFLLAVTLLIYWPSYRAGFIWDDDPMITANPLVKAGWDGLRDIWFSTKFHDYVPLTLTSFWVEWRLWGAEKAGYHVVNVLLHAVNVLLVWRVLLRLRLPGAWLAALVFAVHPVCVASVTWVAERKNTLSMFFYLLSLLLYLRSESAPPRPSLSLPASAGAQPVSGARASDPCCTIGPPNFRLYCFSLIAFIVGLLSKTSIVILPVVLLLCAWWQRGRISRQDLGRAVPFFLAAFICGLMTLGIHQYRAPAEGVAPVTDSLLVRALGGTRAVWFYLGKALLPLSLTMHYPKWIINPASPLSYLPGLLILGAFAIFWWFRRSWGRACLFAFGYFVLALSPTLGLIKMMFLTLSQVADHFQYLALPGIIALVAGGGCHAWKCTARTAQGSSGERLSTFGPQLSRLGLLVGAVVVVICFTTITWRRERIVGDAEALWRDNIQKNPGSWPAHNNLGRIFAEQGKHKEAAEECVAALIIDPDAPDVYYNLGNAMLAQGNLDKAIRAYSEVIRLAPSDSKAHNNLACALFQKRRVDEALRHAQAAVNLDSENVEARCNLADILSQQGKSQQAIAQYQRVLRLRPDNATAHDNVGRLLAAGGKLDEALPHFAQAVRLKPDLAEAQANLGNALFQKGQLEQSLPHYFEALRLQPADAVARTSLGDVLTKLGRSAEAQVQYGLAHYTLAGQRSKQGKVEEAIQHYLEALRLRPDFGEAHYEVGLMLLQQHKTAEALDHWRQALKSKPDWAEVLNNLAWVLATNPDDRVRNGAEALPLAERACALCRPASLSYLDTLAAAYAETGRFDDAAATCQRALALAEQAGSTERAAQLRQRLQLYQDRRPYREGS